MKTKIWMIVGFAIGFTTMQSWAQCDIPAATSTPHYPTALIDEMTGQPLSSSATKCVVLIHGWNPGGAPNCYDINNGFEFYELINNLKAKLQGTGWSIVAYDWHQDASTGLIAPITAGVPQFLFADANQAAANAQLQGDHLATMLDNTASNLREVQFIAHSAGSHAAREAMIQLLQLNPYVVVQTTFLDPYIPCPSDSLGAFSDFEIDQLPFWNGGSRIIRLENYYADDSPTHGWNAYPWGSYYPPTVNTQEPFYWRSGIDINQEVDWGSILLNPPGPNSASYLANYDWHAGPIQFYADTVDASISGHAASSSLPTGAPYDYRQIGWNRSLYAWESFLPQIVSQPADQTIQSGAAVTFSVSANRANNIDWYVFGGNWVGSGATLTINNFTAANPRVYVARISNNNGELFTRSASVTVGVASAPAITLISPSAFTGLPIGQAQLIRIIGVGFTASSTLTFNDGVTSYPGRVPIFTSANELDYNVTTGTNQANWTVQVVNGSQTSNLGHFTVNAPSVSPAATGSLVVNLSPAGAISAGAQWQVDGTGYNSSGQVVGYITPGSHTVSFKTISGYTTPQNQTVIINANAQTPASGAYSVIAPSTYSLTLNQGGSAGYIVNQPFGSGIGNIYNVGASVQLTANANFGYHFVNWSGDVSGTANPITITMNGNKNVTANFAAGDPNLGTVIVTIQPPEAAAAGVTWGLNDSDFRISGTSYSYYPETVYVELHNTNGWIGVGGWVTFTAGQTSNYTFNASYTEGHIVGTDPRTYYTLAGSAGNSGNSNGVGSAASFSRPFGIAVDLSGTIYIADSAPNNLIRKISPLGAVSTLAGMAGASGSADNIGTNALFSNPTGVAIDMSNNVYVADFGNSTIRKITPSGSVSTFAGLAGNLGSTDTSGGTPLFNGPSGVALDTNGNVYVADSANNAIRKITPAGVVSTLAGMAGTFGSTDQPGNAARFNYPSGVAVDGSGNIYVADTFNHTIRKITSSGSVSTLAGFAGSGGAADGTGTAARFSYPSGVVVDNVGNVFVADNGNNAIRQITPNGVVTTLAGLSGPPGTNDGIGSIVRFHSPTGVAIDGSGDIIVADAANDTIRATRPLTTKIDQTISFAPLPNKSAGDTPFTLTATASSGLVVYFNILSGPAVLDTNNVLTLLGAGAVTAIAWQPGNSIYNAAVPVQQSFNVSQIPQTITFGALSQQKEGDAPFSLNATADSDLPVVFSIVSGPATLSGNILVLNGWGTVIVSASQPGNNSYAAATTVTQSFFATPPDNTIVGPQQLPNGSFQLAFYGLTGSNYLVQASTNLIDWQPFTNFTGTNFLLYFSDSSATNFTHRFYRIVKP